MAENDYSDGPRPLYAVAIHHCIGSGDLAKMKEVCAQCDEWLHKYGNIPVLYELLKSEIAKLEASPAKAS
jgi:hypothetical protein